MMRFLIVCGLAGGLAAVSLVPAAAAPELTAKKEGTTVIFRVDDREMFRYHAEPAPLPRPDIKPEFQRGGYLFPLFTPAGAQVADDYPPNHIHHHGIWWAWTKTATAGTTPDFWNMGQATGRVEFLALDRLWAKDGTVGLTARHQFVSLLTDPPTVVLHESWDLAARAIDGPRPRYEIDLTSNQSCATSQPLDLPRYHYGGLGFRGRRDWDGAANCHFLTSEGVTDRIEGNTSTARWLWVGGQTEYGRAGLTILSHPKNFRSPQPLRLHPTEPFICFAPQQAGPMSITPETPYISHYRLVLADGPPDPEEINRWWTAFAATPVAPAADTPK